MYVHLVPNGTFSLPIVLTLTLASDDIGDRINIEPNNAAGNWMGSSFWIVKDVTLFTTTVSASIEHTISETFLANNLLRSKIILDPTVSSLYI